jgi:hypothetical protein
MNLEFIVSGALAVMLCTAALILSIAIAWILVRDLMVTPKGRRRASNWATALISVASAIGVAFGAAYYLAVTIERLS